MNDFKFSITNDEPFVPTIEMMLKAEERLNKLPHFSPSVHPWQLKVLENCKHFKDSDKIFFNYNTQRFEVRK